jgi:hypothetical protein
MNEQRTYFGKDDPPDESVAPAVSRPALMVLVALFIAAPLFGLILLIALSWHGNSKPPDAKGATPPYVAQPAEKK